MTFNPGNNLKWNYEALALHIKVKSDKKRRPLTYSGCLKLGVCNNFTIDSNGRILLRSVVRTRQWALWRATKPACTSTSGIRIWKNIFLLLLGVQVRFGFT